MAEHTPGPWEVRVNPVRGIIVKTIFGSPWMDESQLIPCVVSPGENAKANAHLIAAAPDLLAACEEWLEYFRKLDEQTEAGDPLREHRKVYHGKRLERTRAAIAKAKGTNEEGTDG